MQQGAAACADGVACSVPSGRGNGLWTCHGVGPPLRRANRHPASCPPAMVRMAAPYTINQRDHGFTECNITTRLSLVEAAGGAYCELPRRSVPPVEVLGAAARPFRWCPIALLRRAPDGGGPKETSGTGLCLRLPRGPVSRPAGWPVAPSTGCRTLVRRGGQG
ncbi:hypothetical protein HMPREF9946_00147 [Acetobacteraceae bacterium AT-5844]|nr:hypothetical protein HMPREF9946_00147 [Acetobacteraceae bacterium AT-5844]